jgi:hypothetical protein
MAYQEFTGELDKPGKYTEFTGQLDAPASQSPGLIASAIDSLGAGMNAVRDWATSSTPESVLQGKVMPEPKFDAAEAERLSTRAYAEGRMNPAAPSMRQGGGIDPESTSTSRGAYLADTIMPVRAAAKAVSGAAQGAGGLIRAAGDVFGSSSLSAAGAATSKGANEFDRAMGDVGQIDGFGPKSPAPYLANMAEGAASSLGQSAAYASMFGARAVIPLMSIMTAGDEYDKARNAGLDPSMALAGAIPKGAFEAIGEKFTGLDKVAGAMGTLLHKGATDQAKREAGQALVRSGIKEIPGEVITYLGQTGVDLLPGIGLKQDLTMSQFIDGLRDTVVQAGMMGGAMGATGRHVSANAPAPLKSAEVMARERGFLTHQNFSAPDSPASLAGITPVVVPVATPAALDAPAAPAAPAGPLPATETGTPAMKGVISLDDQNSMLAQALADAGISGESAAPVAPDLVNKPIPEAQPSASLPQASAVQPTFNQQPETLMMGRSGKGYATQADAKVALQVGQQRQDELGWKIEAIDGGRFRVAGYTTEPVAAPAPVATGAAAQEVAQDQESNQAPARVEQEQEAIKTVAQDKPLNLKMLPLATREIDAAHLGKNGTPLNEGGKPFKTKDEASAARQLQPMMRVVKSPTGKGFSLAPKTEAQLAAQDKAAKRLSLARTGKAGVPTAAHEFIAGAGGMDASTRTEFSFGANPRVGNRTLFAGARGGMSIEAATQKLIEARYLPAGASHSDTVALINRSFTQPQYTVDGTEVMAEAQRATRFEDHLAAQQEAAQNDNFDPFAPLTEQEYTAADMAGTGYAQASAEIQQEVAALSAQLDAMGIDAEEIRMDIAAQNSQATNQEYYELTKAAITSAINEQAAVTRGRSDTGQNDDEQGQPAPGREGQEAGLTAPSRAEVLAQQERTDNAQALDDKAQIDAEAQYQTLTRQSAPEQRTDTSGDMFAVEKAQAVIDKRNAGVEQAKDPSQAGMFDEPAQEDADELSRPIDQLRKIARDDDHPGSQEARSELARHGLGYGHGNSDHLITGSMKPPSEEWMQVQNFRRRGVYELDASDLKRFLKLAKARSLDAFEGQAISDRDSTISKWLAESKPTEPVAQTSTKTPSADELRAKADLMNALADLGSIFNAPFKANITPEQEQKLLPVLTRVLDAAFRLGYSKFKDAAKFALEQIRAALGAETADALTLDHLQGAYIAMAGGKQGADTKRAVIDIEAKSEIESHAAQTDNERNGESNAPSTDSRVERDSQEPGAQSAVGNAVSPESGRTGATTSQAGGRPDRSAGRGQQDGAGVPFGSAPVAGERGDQRLHSAGEQPELASIVTGADFREPGGDSGITGVPAEPIAASQVDAVATGRTQQVEGQLKQRRADKTPVALGDIDNIRTTLPQLLPGQQDDVLLAEQRFAKADGYGMLFTNGTGTGKTYSGLGVIKRFALQGKTNTLIAAPDSKIASDWIESGKLLGLDITSLKDTKDAGKGIVITTYANLGENDALARRKWDLVVADEAHSLMQAADGEPTGYLHKLRAITNHPDGAHTRYSMLHRAEIERATALGQEIIDTERDMAAADTTAMRRGALEVKSEELQAELGALRKQLDAAKAKVLAAVKSSQGAGRTRLVALSATPFAYEKTIDWANGYLFDYSEGMTGENHSSGSGAGHGYNSGDWRDKYFMQHFGYSMRYNKLTRPDANVDGGLMQRQWNANLKRSGALSGRMLDVKPDYDRRFILVESAIGNRIDEALEWISEQRQAEKGQGPYADLGDAINEQFKYLQKRYLLEAIKATEVIPIVKAHLALGRKVVVFHDYKKGGGFNPFRVNTAGKSDMAAAVQAFEAKFKDLINAPLGSMPSPIEVFRRELPQTLLINGDEKKADLLARYKSFQNDDNGPQVMLVQSAKNKGWSGHDTTGKHQRVLINLGQPTAPTLAIQQEGRIYRTGQASDAIMRYMNTGTNWERWTFATTIASRASTAENLGMGEMARALKDSFIQSFEESDTYAPGHEGEGKGGKERDQAANDAITEYDRAKTFYFGQQKKNSRTKAQEGADYFATPEPLGLKMTQWLDARGGEDTLEPSGGHGAIARWLPENTKRTVIEPSLALRSRLSMVMNPTEDRIIAGTFEDHHVGNKYDGIVMNPPFGTAGRTAIDHLAQAATHLRDGGRIVALIPTGPASDKKFDKWFYESSEKAVKPLFIDPNHGPIYKGDTLTITGFGTLQTIVINKVDGQATGPRYVRDANTTPEGAINATAINKVSPTGKRTESFKPAEGLQLVANIKLPQITFERAGTAVATRVVVIEKSDRNIMQRDRDLSDITDIKELFDRLENLDFPARAKPVEAAPVEAAKAEKPAPAAKPAKAMASAGDQVTMGDKTYPVEIYTTNAGKEKRGVWMDSKADASKYSARTFTHSSNKGKWFVDEYWFPKDAKVTQADSGVKFSRQETTTRGTPVPRVQAVVDAITAHWANAPEVVVVSDMQDEKVPQKVREADQLQKSQGAEGEPDGFIYKGTVYLVASELPTINDAVRVLMHEALGHSGLRGAFGDALKPILSQVAAMRRADIVKKAREYGLLNPATPRDASVNEQWQAMSEKNRQVAAEEVLAVMAEKHPELGFVKRAVSAIRNWLRANVPGVKSLAMTDADIIQAFILPARRHIEGKQASSTAKNTSLEAIAQRESNLLDLIACLG